MEIRLYYEDTDSGGVVYYANYLRYLERARTEFFRNLGCDVGVLMEKGFLFVVTHVNLHYHLPARYNDVIKIETIVGEMRKASFILTHQIFLKKNDALLLDGQIKMACLGPEGKPRRLPDEMVQVLK
ncbi:MAG TPA: YbgC/FadM family acyl-CoA thioesterase [Nitrospiria bacterium]|jgi:acyl-CoA thioester hydrolase